MIMPFIAAWRSRHPEYAGRVPFDTETPFLGVYTPPDLPIFSGNRGRRYVYVVDFESLESRDRIMLAAITDSPSAKWRYRLNDEPWSPIIEGCSIASVGEPQPGQPERIKVGMNSLKVLEYNVEEGLWPQLEDAQESFFEYDGRSVHAPELSIARGVFLEALLAAATGSGVHVLDCNSPTEGIPDGVVIPIGCDSDDWYEVVPLNPNLNPLAPPIPERFESYPPAWPS
jgi:hypothetical protein